MARPTRATVDYFPCDATFSSSIQCIEQEFGSDGIAFWVKLLQAFCKHEFHYIDVRPSNTKRCLFYAKELGFPVEVCQKILNRLAEYGSIDAELYNDGIIFSEHFIERIASVYKKRNMKLKTKADLKNEFQQLKGDENPNFRCENSITAAETLISEAEMPQSKVNKTKVNKIKVEESTSPASDLSAYKEELKNWHGEYSNVHLTEQQFGKLLALTMSKEAVKLVIDQLSENIASKKEKAQPYDENFPEMHFIACKNYWNFYRMNPEKFKQRQQQVQQKEADFSLGETQQYKGNEGWTL